jgi:hypothetical protein
LTQQRAILDQLLHSKIALNFDKKISKFNVVIDGQNIQQNVCEFLLTSSFLIGQDPEKYLLSTDTQYDTVTIPMTMAGKIVTVDLSDFIYLREAYSRQHYLLKLEDILLYRGINLPG